MKSKLKRQRQYAKNKEYIILGTRYRVSALKYQGKRTINGQEGFFFIPSRSTKHPVRWKRMKTVARIMIRENRL